MASIHLQRGRPFYYCSFLGPDGKWHFRSTGTRNKHEAMAICTKMDQGARLSRRGRLTPERAREIIEATVNEIMDLSGQVMPRSSICEFFRAWLSEKVWAPGTRLRYEGVVERFIT